MYSRRMTLLARLVMWTLALLQQGTEGTGSNLRKSWTKLHPADFPSGSSVSSKNVQDPLICSMAALGVGTCRIFCFNFSVKNCALYETKIALKPYCTENCQSGEIVCFHKVPPDDVFLGNGTTPIVLNGADAGKIKALNIYDAPMEHRWHLMASPGYFLQIKITFFDFGSCGCGCNSISFRNLNTSAVIGGHTYCGSYSTFTINLQENMVELLLLTNGSNLLPGFELEYKSKNSYRCIPDLTVLTNTSGYIDIKRVNDESMTCTWRLSMPQGTLAKITFLEFDLGSCCSCATIVLKDSAWTYGNFMGASYCGSVIPPVVQASGSNVIDVVLLTNGASELPGFKLYYETIPEPVLSKCTGDIALTASVGILHASPPDSYFNSQKCSWLVTVATGKKVGVFVQWFKTESCCDKLAMKDLATSASLGDAQYSGERTIPLLTSTGNSVNISFTTDGSVLSLGFQIFYFTAD